MQRLWNEMVLFIVAYWNPLSPFTAQDVHCTSIKLNADAYPGFICVEWIVFRAAYSCLCRTVNRIWPACSTTCRSHSLKHRFIRIFLLVFFIENCFIKIVKFFSSKWTLVVFCSLYFNDVRSINLNSQNTCILGLHSNDWDKETWLNDKIKITSATWFLQ